jgi:hypothetical protein
MRKLAHLAFAIFEAAASPTPARRPAASRSPCREFRNPRWTQL